MRELLNEIFSFLPDKDRFATIQRVSKEWKAVVWHPEFNRDVCLHLDSRNPKDIQTRMFRKFEKKLHALVGPAGLWSQLQRLSITGVPHDSDMINSILQTGPFLQSLELIRPDPEAVCSLVESSCKLENVTRISIKEVELESLHEIDFFSFSLLTSLSLEEVFLVKDHSVLSLTPPSPADDFISRESHNLKSLDLYILPFSELLNFLKLSLTRFLFPCLLHLRLRCLSSSQHADQLASVIDSKVPVGGWSSLASIEVGIVTDDLVECISSKCDPANLREMKFPSKLDLTLMQTFYKFANRFNHVSDLTVRIKSSKQLEELAEVITDTPWQFSIDRLKISWSLVNSISVTALTRLRICLGKGRSLHASSRMASIQREDSRGKKDAYSIFFQELCKDRLVCECEECAGGQVVEEHVRALAEEEWEAELPRNLRDQLIQLYL